MNYFKRNIGEEQKEYLSRIKALLMTEKNKDIAMSKINSLFSPMKSKLSETAVIPTTKLFIHMKNSAFIGVRRRKFLIKLRHVFCFAQNWFGRHSLSRMIKNGYLVLMQKKN